MKDDLMDPRYEANHAADALLSLRHSQPAIQSAFQHPQTAVNSTNIEGNADGSLEDSRTEVTADSTASSKKSLPRSSMLGSRVISQGLTKEQVGTPKRVMWADEQAERGPTNNKVYIDLTEDSDSESRIEDPAKSKGQAVSAPAPPEKSTKETFLQQQVSQTLASSEDSESESRVGHTAMGQGMEVAAPAPIEKPTRETILQPQVPQKRLFSDDGEQIEQNGGKEPPLKTPELNANGNLGNANTVEPKNKGKRLKVVGGQIVNWEVMGREKECANP